MFPAPPRLNLKSTHLSLLHHLPPPVLSICIHPLTPPPLHPAPSTQHTEQSPQAAITPSLDRFICSTSLSHHRLLHTVLPCARVCDGCRGCRSHPQALFCTEIGAHSQSTGFLQLQHVMKSIGILKNGIRPRGVLSHAILPPLLLHHFPGLQLYDHRTHVQAQRRWLMKCVIEIA